MSESVVHQVRVPRDLKEAFRARCEELSISESAGTRLAMQAFVIGRSAAPAQELSQAAGHIESVIKASSTMSDAFKALGVLFKKDPT
jgi:hypothetical protein